MSAFTLRVSNFRGVHAAWTPMPGVCALVGPNGAGKTVVLTALALLQNYYLRSKHVWKTAHKPRGALSTEPVEVALTVVEGETRLSWILVFSGDAAPKERLLQNGQEVDLPPSKPWSSALVVLALECRAGVDLAPLLGFLRGLRVSFPEKAGADVSSLWTQSDYWRNDNPPGSGEKYAWIKRELRLAFPGFFPEPDSDPMDVSSGGVLQAMRLLLPVAWAQPGHVLAFDDVERSLHPHAIRSLLQGIRQRAECLDLTVLLTTHSPVVLNEFGNESRRDQFDRVYLMGPGGPIKPLLECYDESWLSHFSLGDVYAGGGLVVPEKKEST